MVHDNDDLTFGMDDEILDAISNLKIFSRKLAMMIYHDDIDVVRQRFAILGQKIEEIDAKIDTMSKDYILFLKTDKTDADFKSMRKLFDDRISELEESIINCSMELNLISSE